MLRFVSGMCRGNIHIFCGGTAVRHEVRRASARQSMRVSSRADQPGYQYTSQLVLQ